MVSYETLGICLLAVLLIGFVIGFVVERSMIAAQLEAKMEEIRKEINQERVKLRIRANEVDHRANELADTIEGLFGEVADGLDGGDPVLEDAAKGNAPGSM